MRHKKMILAWALMANTAAWAQKADGLIVTSGETEQQFAISEVKELRFGDAGLTVVRTDEATLEFSAGWQIRFGEVESTGISFARISDTQAKAQVFDAGGKLVKEVRLSELRVGELPKGIYIIMCNGKSLKILR